MSEAAFAGAVAAISPTLRQRMTGRSWHPDPRCPPFDDLRLLTVDHWDYAGAVRTGQLVVAAPLAAELLAILGALFQQRFPIARMELVDTFAGDDDASMAANNTSCFNFRTVAGTETLSDHAFGAAVDINPVQNPMVIGAAIHPPAGAAHLDRTVAHPGLITRPGPVVALFESHGWRWGGDWTAMKDYHHFARPGLRPR